jgi:hypothetical protein
MSRILFIFAKVHPSVQYIQGMNEVLAPIFFLLNNKIHSEKQEIQEAACFFMFINVLSDLLVLNIADFDHRDNGIYSRMRKVDRTLLIAEPLLWSKLNSFEIDQTTYCFRWLALFFAQDFEIFSILRIWESLFSCQDRQLYVNCFAVALLIGIKDKIMGGDK